MKLSYIHIIPLYRYDEADKEQRTINPWSRRCSATSEEGNLFINIIGYHLSIYLDSVYDYSVLFLFPNKRHIPPYIRDRCFPDMGVESHSHIQHLHFDPNILISHSSKCWAENADLFLFMWFAYSLCDVKKCCNNPKWERLKT